MQTEQIGKYKLVSVIGEGAVGRVFRAFDPVLGRHLAVKALSIAARAGSESVERFKREAHAAAVLNHPNIVTIYEFGEHDGVFFIAMELLEGMDLREAMQNQRLVSVAEKLGAMEQVCEGLGYAHAQGIIHRDLKPANMHVSPHGRVKIMDFGLARLGQSDMTTEGSVLGTPNYMSPEQVRGERADNRSDIFSVGAVLYELLANRKPFEADNLTAVFFNVLQQEPESLRQRSADLPESVERIVLKALSKEPQLRFQNVTDLQKALRLARKEIESRGKAESAAEGSAETSARKGEALGPHDSTIALSPPGTRSSAEEPLTLCTADLFALVETGRELKES
jgi:serine/threonine-protein kinase